MAFEIPDHFHRQFTTNVELLLQESQPMMGMGVDLRSYSGEAAQVVKQFGEVEFSEKVGRNTDTTFSDIQHKQRWIFPTDYNLALPIDNEDELRMLNSPQSSYAQAMRAAWARRSNVIIRDALLGDANTGKNGATTTGFDTSNQQIAASTSGMTIAKLREALEILKSNQVDDSDPLFMAMTSAQFTDLLETTEVTSSDYNTVKALVSGDIDAFLGFKFLRYEGLGIDGSSDRRCIAWAKSGLVHGTWNGLETRIDERPDKNYLTQVYMAGTQGATRTQEKKVVEVLCVEA